MDAAGVGEAPVDEPDEPDEPESLPLPLPLPLPASEPDEDPEPESPEGAGGDELLEAARESLR